MTARFPKYLRTAILTLLILVTTQIIVVLLRGCDEWAAGREVDCTEEQRSKYYAEISGPLLDRIDIQVDVRSVKFPDMVSKIDGAGSEEIRSSRRWKRAAPAADYRSNFLTGDLERAGNLLSFEKFLGCPEQ